MVDDNFTPIQSKKINLSNPGQKLSIVGLPRNQNALGVSPDMNGYSSRGDRENTPSVSSRLRGLLLIGAILCTGLVLYFSSRPKLKNPQVFPTIPVSRQSSLRPSIIAPSVALLGKYAVDTDKDCVPDAVESATGYDPKKDECTLENFCKDPNLKETQNKQVNVMLILDSSGSMGALTSDGKLKVDAAKEAVAAYVASIPVEVNFGLMVYGHKGSNSASDKPVSCAGVEVLYPLGKPDKAAVSQAVSLFKATGWTPIADSLKIAGEQFVNYKDQNNYIILVSDGEETCGGDPVAQAQALKSQGIATKIDVVGFAVDENTKMQLEQIAKLGGGSYFPAANAQELIDTLKTKGENVMEQTRYLNCMIDSYIKDHLNCLLDRKNAYMKYVAGKIDEVLGLYGHKKGEFSQAEYDELKASFASPDFGGKCLQKEEAVNKELQERLKNKTTKTP